MMQKKTETPKPAASGRQKGRLFVPILAGATLRERLLACIGAMVGIALTSLICSLLYGQSHQLPLIVAPMGASAVLLFAVPASPLAQPWSIIGGNTVSALVGVTVAYFVKDSIVAAGLAVSLAILAMSFTRCLHPPGGAAALTAIVGGPVIAETGFLFPFIPVGLNSLLLVLIGIAFHAVSRRNYPHVAPPANTHGTKDSPPQTRVGFQTADIDAALAMLDETFDIDRADLERLLRQVELQALARTHSTILCGDIMSRDVVAVSVNDEPKLARTLLLKHNIRTLPVIGDGRRLEGAVGLREVMNGQGRIGAIMSPALVASAADPAIELVPALTDGRAHAVFVVDEQRRVLGLITQTDLLALLAREMVERQQD